MDQSSRIAELDRFKMGEINILVASDVAARGLDIKGVSHVFNYDTPWHPDDYIHRIGRTGRAGAKGKAYTMVTPEDAEAIANVEKLTGLAIAEFGASKAEPRQPREREAAPRDERGAEDRPRRRRSRREEPREERPRIEKVLEERPPAEKPAPATRQPAPRRQPEPADADDDGDWNGPVPGFLGRSAL
jgi:superfamily II DNA/RNA helicase